MADTNYQKQHKNYVLGLAKNDIRLRDFFDDHEKLCSFVKRRLEGITPLAGPENLPNSDPSECSKLSDHQLVKLVWLVDSLEMNRELRESIGTELEADYKDKKSAHGGVITFKDNRLQITMIPGRPIPSEIFGARKNYENYSYDPVEFDLAPDAMFLFHFHAFEEDNSRFASPTNSDLKEAERRKADGLVFTKIMGNRFNADYYFVGRDKDNRPFNVVLDLGVYEY